MCVVGKNYRLQDIQLSKISRGQRPEPRAVARAAPATHPRRRRAKTLTNLVENTGLEPVTSWLQTRRSPS